MADSIFPAYGKGPQRCGDLAGQSSALIISFPTIAISSKGSQPSMGQVRVAAIAGEHSVDGFRCGLWVGRERLNDGPDCDWL